MILSPSTAMASCVINNPLDQYMANIIGMALSCALWGAGSLQTFLYFMNYASDPLLLKALVVVVWMMGTVVEVLLFVGIFPLMASPTSIVTASIPPALVIRTLFTYVIALIVQVFFLYRIYRFSRESLLVRFFLALTTLIALWQIVGVSLWAAFSIYKTVANVFTSPRDISISISCRAISAFVDVVIAVWMTFLLQSKRRHIFRRSERLIFRLTIMTVNTGLWTAVFAVIDFSLIAWRPTNLVFSVFEYPLGALYANTLLANLNARQYMRSVAWWETDAPSDTTDVSNTRAARVGSSLKFASRTTELSPVEEVGGTADGVSLQAKTKNGVDSAIELSR